MHNDAHIVLKMHTFMGKLECEEAGSGMKTTIHGVCSQNWEAKLKGGYSNHTSSLAKIDNIPVFNKR